MKRAAFGALLLAGGPAFAEEPKGCFEVVPPAANSPAPLAIKVDRCTGTTWILVRAYGPKPKDGTPGPFSWRWFPLQDAGSEALIGQ